MAPRKSTRKKPQFEDQTTEHQVHNVKTSEPRKTRQNRLTTEDSNAPPLKKKMQKKSKIIVKKLCKNIKGKLDKRLDIQSKRGNVLEAMALVNTKNVSVRRAASLCNLSYSYLYRRLTGEMDVDRRNGPRPVFTCSEEEEMAKWLLEMAVRKMGLKAGEVLDFTRDLVIKKKIKNPFTDNRPAHAWYHVFLSRNKHIIDPDRYKSLIRVPKTSKENTIKCCESFREFLSAKNLSDKPHQIWSVDECILGLNKTEKKIVGLMKTKSSYQPARHSQPGKRITAMFCCSADDQVMPPFLIYPRPEPHKQNMLKGALLGTTIHYTKTGGFDEYTFMKYLDHFDKFCGADRPVCLLVDGVRGSINMSVYQRALEKGIELYGAMPNPVDLMQPIHGGFFGQLSTKWQTVVKQHYKNNQNQSITKYNFAKKMREAYQDFLTRGTLVVVDGPEYMFMVEDDDDDDSIGDDDEDEDDDGEEDVEDEDKICEEENYDEEGNEKEEFEEAAVPVTDPNEVPMPSHYCEVLSNDIQMVEEMVSSVPDTGHHILVHSNDIQMVEETVMTVPDPSQHVEVVCDSVIQTTRGETVTIDSPSRKKKRKMESLERLLKKKNNTKFNADNMNASHAKAERAREAIRLIKEEQVSIRHAASVCKLSTSYLYRRVKGEIEIDSRNGPPPTLSKFEEEALALWLMQMARQRMGLQAKEVLEFAQKLLKKEKRKTPFVDDRPGYEWYYAFLWRNSHVIDPNEYKKLCPSRDNTPDNKFDVWYAKFRKFVLSNARFVDKYILGVNKIEKAVQFGVDADRQDSIVSGQGKRITPGRTNIVQSGTTQQEGTAVADENEDPVHNQENTETNPSTVTTVTIKEEKASSLEEKQSKIDRVLQAFTLIKEDKISLRQAAAKCNLSTSYLYRRYHGEIDLHRRNGPTPILGKSTEELFAKWLLDMAERRLALLPKEVFDAVQKFVLREKIETPFVDGKPGHDWYNSFLSRNQHILDPDRYKYLCSVRVKSQLGRLESWNKMFEEFAIMKDLLEKPKQIWNVDECTVDIDHKGNVCGSMKTNSSLQWTDSDHNQKKLTSLFCCSADDDIIPPFLIYPKPVPKGEPLNCALKGTVLEYTTKGRMDSDILMKFIDHFDKHCGSDRPVCLLIDSFKCHLDLEVFNSAIDKGIELYGAMPNIGTLMQPFYRNIFGQLNAKWNQVTENNMIRSPKSNIGKSNFAKLLSEAYMEFDTQGIDISHMLVTNTPDCSEGTVVEINTSDEEEEQGGEVITSGRETTPKQRMEKKDLKHREGRKENTASSRELSPTLLSTSDDQPDDSEDAICMVCHMTWVEDQSNVSTWVECSLCRKWIHEDCIPMGIDTSGLEDENEAFFCHNCI